MRKAILLVAGILFFLIAYANHNDLMGLIILGTLFIFLSCYWLICIIWAAISASNANKIVINANYADNR